MTISFWAYPVDISKSRQNPLGKAYGGEFNFTMETNGRLTYYHGAAGTNSGPYMYAYVQNMFSNNTWAYITIVRDNSEQKIKFYKNGSLCSSSQSSWINPVASTRPLKIGYEYAGYWKGRMDDIRIYRRR